jgi:hypothetical protein
MFHTLSELQEKEKKSKNKKTNNNYKISLKKSFPEDNCYGKGNKAYDHYNQKGIEDNNTKFEKTKNKIKLVAYKNGFILNNGPFRDRSIPENNKFMLEVEKGNIPQEIVDKGITDLGILLINRKNEIYYPPIDVSPITHITQITQINPINPITINPVNQYNPINQFNQNQQIYNNINSQPYEYQSSYPYQFLDEFFEFDVIDNPYGYTVENRPRSNTLNRNLPFHPPQTPIGTRNVRNNIFETKAEKKKETKRKKSAPKKESKKRIRTFESFKKMEFLKEEEEKKKKLIEREKLRKNIGLDEIEEEDKKEKERDKSEEKKKFKAFAGEGKTIGNINIEGLNVHKEVKNVIDSRKPVCTVSVRLFNGEIVKGNFNKSQKLRDLYYFVKKTSGSKDFYLLDGFPPQPLKDYNQTIGELKLENTILTQKIN